LKKLWNKYKYVLGLYAIYSGIVIWVIAGTDMFIEGKLIICILIAILIELIYLRIQSEELNKIFKRWLGI